MSEVKYVGSKSLRVFLNNLKNIFATKSPVKGATSSSNGASGLVPSPLAGDQNKCLLGNGTYGYPDIISDDNLYDPLETEE